MNTTTPQFAAHCFDNMPLEELKKRITPSWDPARTKLHMKMLGIPPGTRSVLEIGCGIGRLGREICKRKAVKRYTGIAASHDMIKEAPGYCTSKKAEFAESQTDGNFLFQLKSYDFVFAFLIFQHILDTATVDRLVCSMCRWVKPGGSVMVQLLAHDEKPGHALWVYYDPGEMVNYMAALGVTVHVEKLSSRWVAVRGVKEVSNDK